MAPVHHDLLERQAAQHGGDRGGLGVPHGRVANESQVRLQRLGVLGEEGGQGGRARFLFALEQHADVARQAAGLAEGAAGLEEGHQLAFVVAGAARDDALPVRPVREARLEGRRRPQLERVGGLHVVMAVEQHMRRVARLGLGGAHHHRPAGRVLPRGFESEIAQLARQPVGGAVAIGEMGGDRRDRGNREQREKTIEGVALIGVDRRKHILERGHENSGAAERTRTPAAFAFASIRRAARLQLRRPRDASGGSMRRAALGGKPPPATPPIRRYGGTRSTAFPTGEWRRGG